VNRVNILKGHLNSHDIVNEQLNVIRIIKLSALFSSPCIWVWVLAARQVNEEARNHKYEGK
jgi:hypothetical protein